MVTSTLAIATVIHISCESKNANKIEQYRPIYVCALINQLWTYDKLYLLLPPFKPHLGLDSTHSEQVECISLIYMYLCRPINAFVYFTFFVQSLVISVLIDTFSA